MKSAIKEYLNLTNQEKKNLWENAVFVFDTNIFLNLYRYTEITRKSLLNAMQQLSDRIWMPKHVAEELMKDRPEVILNTLKIFDEINTEKEKFINSCKNKLRRENRDTKIEEFSKKIDAIIEEFKKESHFVEDINNDEILKELLELFDGKVGKGFDEETLDKIKADGKNRYQKQIPPGYKDCNKGEQNNSYGDLIIWKEIIGYAKQNKKDIIYVTGDQKEDWWHKVNGRTLGPRIELKKEFYEETNQIFHMYNMNRFLLQFQEIPNSHIQQSAIDEVKNYESMLEENHRRIMQENHRARELERILLEKQHLTEKLHSLTMSQEHLQARINDAKKLLNTQNLYDSNVEQMENSRRLLEEIQSDEAHLIDIIKQQAHISHDIDALTKHSNRLIHSMGRNMHSINSDVR